VTLPRSILDKKPIADGFGALGQDGSTGPCGGPVSLSQNDHPPNQVSIQFLPETYGRRGLVQSLLGLNHFAAGQMDQGQVVEQKVINPLIGNIRHSERLA
jgi:hypothetical protein